MWGPFGLLWRHLGARVAKMTPRVSKRSPRAPKSDAWGTPSFLLAFQKEYLLLLSLSVSPSRSLLLSLHVPVPPSPALTLSLSLSVSFSLPSFFSFLLLFRPSVSPPLSPGVGLGLLLGLGLGLGQARWRGCPQGSWIYPSPCPRGTKWNASNALLSPSPVHGVVLWDFGPPVSDSGK